MGQVTHEQANLLLQLYEMRREPRLREARAWFFANFDAKTLEEMNQKYPPMSEANTSLRMTTSYWDMAAGFCNRGLIDDEMFFENSGEAWIVWDRMREVVPAMRAMFKNPHAYGQLEALAKRMEAWQERRAPGHIEAMRQMLSRGRASTAKS
jgi:hypothetical protein